MDNQPQVAELSIGSEAMSEDISQAVPAGAEIPDEILSKLVGKPAGKQPETDNAATDAESSEPPKSLNDLADAAGGPDELYKMVVSLSEEMGTATVEELKADATAYRKGQRQQEKFETSQTDFSNQKLRYMTELQQAVAAIPPDQWTEERRIQVGAFIRQQQDRQDAILVESVPGWDDRVTRERDEKSIRDYLSTSYGAPTEAYDQPAPAWAKKLIYDHWKLNQRMSNLATKRRKPPKSSGQGANVDTAAKDRIAGAKGSKLDSIVALLNQG